MHETAYIAMDGDSEIGYKVFKLQHPCKDT